MEVEFVIFILSRYLKERNRINLIMPETEAEILTGIEVDNAAAVGEAGKKLLDLGAKNAIITMGKHGAMLVTTEESSLVPAFEVEAVDATAAGDAFTGSLAFALASGRELKEAVKFANSVAALAVTRMGAQPSMPTGGELQDFLVGKSEIDYLK